MNINWKKSVCWTGNYLFSMAGFMLGLIIMLSVGYLHYGDTESCGVHEPTIVAVNHVDDAVVKITTLTGMGSGVLIDYGVVLTAAHVVDGPLPLLGCEIDPLALVYIEGVSYVVDISKSLISNNYDVAILKLVDPPASHYSLELAPSSEVGVGEEVEAIGFPLHMGIWHSFGHKARDSPGPSLFADIDINHGNSGGPILYKGKIIGIASVIITGTDISECVASEICIAQYNIWRFMYGQ